MQEGDLSCFGIHAIRMGLLDYRSEDGWMLL